jgi:hypothetical protein
MALERFIPKSPDIFIRNSQDFEVAKFGHLNTIVEYINNNSAKPAGLNGYVQFNDNTALGGDAGLFWDNVNKRLGVGTVTPIVPLNIYNNNPGISSVILVEQDTSAIIGQINQYRKNGSVNLISGAEIGRLSFGGYFNSTYSPFSQVCSAITAYYGGTGTDRVGGLRLTTWNGFGQTTRLQVAPDGKVSIGTTGSNAKLQIVGEGSTSATTSLLVQNSLGTTLLQTLDDATTTLAGKTFTGTGTILVPSQAHSASDIVMKGDSALISANGNANQWAKIILSDAGANTTYQNSAGTHNFKIGTTSPTTYLTIAANNITTGLSTRITMGANDASDIYQGTGANVYGSFLPFGGSGYTVFKNSYTLGSYRFFTAPAVDGTLVEALRITNTGNVGIGLTSPTARLQIKGSGSTSATTSLLVQNSSGTEAFKVTDDRTTTISGTQTNLSTTNVYVGALSLTSAGVGVTGQGIWSTGTDGQMVLAGSLGGFVIKGWAGYTVSLINNSNPRNLFSIQQYGFSDGNTSGLTGNTMNITPIYNFTGAQSSATVRGIYYNPTLTSLVNTTHYGIQTTSGGAYINTATPQASACLQADSTTQGFLPPRMTTAQRLAIASPAASLIVFDTDVQNLCYRRDGVWVQATFAAV